MEYETVIDTPRQLTIEQDLVELDVSLHAGRVTVVGTEGAARVEVSAVGPDTPLYLEVDAGVLRLRHGRAKTWPGPLRPLWWWLVGGRHVHAEVSVAVPAGTRANVRTTAGSVVISGLRADLSAQCVSGRVTLLDDHGRIRARVVSGPIEVLGCAGEVALETVSGEISVADSATRRLHAKTVSGAVAADLDNPPRDSDIRLETISGEITVRIREDSDVSVDIAALHGRITSTFPELVGDSRRGAAVRGRLGSGTGSLRIRAVGGNVSVLGRPVDHDHDLDDGPETAESRPGSGLAEGTDQEVSR